MACAHFRDHLRPDRRDHRRSRGRACLGSDPAPGSDKRASQLVTQGVSYELALTIAVALSFGVVFSLQWFAGLISSLWPASSAVKPWVSLGNVYKFYGPSLLLFYIPKALLLGLACGIAVNATSPWLRYFTTVSILAHKNLLPRRSSGIPRLGLQRRPGAPLRYSCSIPPRRTAKTP